MLLPRRNLGIYRGNIVVPAVPLSTIVTVEIAGDVAPAPVFGTVGNLSLCSNCSHTVVRSTETSGPAVISATACRCLGNPDAGG